MSPVTLPQPGPNSTTRRGASSARQLSRWPAGGQVSSDHGQRAALVGERTLAGQFEVEGRGFVRRVVGVPSRDAAVERPGPLPVRLGEGVRRWGRRQGERERLEQGVRLVGRRGHEGGGPIELGVELVDGQLSRSWPAQGGADPTAGPARQGIDRPPGQRGRVRRRGRLRSMRRGIRNGPVKRARPVRPRGGGGRPGQPAQVPCPEGGLVRGGEVRVQRSRRVPALEEAEGVGRPHVLGPEVLQAAGVTPAGRRHLGQAGQDVLAVGRVEAERSGMMIMPGGYRLRRRPPRWPTRPRRACRPSSRPVGAPGPAAPRCRRAGRRPPPPGRPGSPRAPNRARAHAP